jgi:hypothetical protein
MSYYHSPAAYRTQDEIKDTTDCPLCGVQRSTACVYTGRGSAAAMRQGKSHEARHMRAQDILRGFDPSDYRLHPSVEKNLVSPS